LLFGVDYFLPPEVASPVSGGEQQFPIPETKDRDADVIDLEERRAKAGYDTKGKAL
jgi:hypothetical protein